MGLFFRKGVKVGPLRINFSKSGVGVSAGVKGLRVGTGPRGNYVSAGRGGLYYRKYFGGTKRSHSATGLPNAPTPPPVRESVPPANQKRVLFWPWLVLLSVAIVAAMAWNGMSQTSVAIAANTLLALCIAVGVLDRRRKPKVSPLEQGVWIDFDREKGIAFRIAPGTNAVATTKLRALAGDDLRANRTIAPAVIIETMIGTVLLDWRGFTNEGKPFPFSPENARLVLTQSQEICDFVSDKAMELDAQTQTVPLPPDSTFTSPEELARRPMPKVVDTTLLPSKPVERRKPSLAELREQTQKVDSHTWPGNYVLPDLSLLNKQGPEARAAASFRELERIQELLAQTFSTFGITVSPGAIVQDVAGIRYEFNSNKQISSDEIAKLEHLMVATVDTDWVRIVSLLDERTRVDVIMSNAGRTNVSLKQVLLSQDWEASRATARLPVVVGRDTNGKTVAADLSELPHVLIAGTTGSGKSACIDAMLASLLFQFSPGQLRLIMIDMRFQMQIYDRLPHLAFPIISDPRKALLALGWLIDEMNRRYRIFGQTDVRSIASFNERQVDRSVELDNETDTNDLPIPDSMPFIVVVIDDLADLTQATPSDIESAIARITHLARATGVYLIIATQIPRTDVITRVITANIPCRIAFKVASKLDSRLILDANGAERLLGEGDMLYHPASAPHYVRAQGAFVSDEELKRIVDFISSQVPDFNVPSETSIHEDVTEGG